MRKVDASLELARIVALPRRHEAPLGAEHLSKVLRTPRGSQTLRPIQAQALAELHCVGGILGPIRVGGGKTLVSFLAPRMIGAERPLLLVPAKLREKTKRDFVELTKHWVPGAIPKVFSYEMLGRVNASTFLEEMRPDLIIADEAHRLKNVHASCTRRVGRYMSKHPSTRFVALSGTITQRSLMDYAHLTEWALRSGAPVPLKRYDLEQWSMALDEGRQWDEQLHPGAILRLVKDEQGDDLTKARLAYQRRLRETPGVIVSDGKGIAASISITKWEPKVSPCPELKEAFAILRNRWETPDGRPLISAVDVWRHARELAQGFWYRWDPAPPQAWIEARRAWAAFAREILSRSRSLDSEAQVAAAHKSAPELLMWQEIRPTFTPNVVASWLSSEYILRTKDWVKEDEKQGLIWVEHVAVGAALEAIGVPYFGRLGLRGKQQVEDYRGALALSIAANSEGRNLQYHSRNIVLSPPTTGAAWEQMIGRTHREGQTADEITVEVLLGCPESRDGFNQAIADAEYQRQTTGLEQKLLLGDRT